MNALISELNLRKQLAKTQKDSQQTPVESSEDDLKEGASISEDSSQLLYAEQTQEKEIIRLLLLYGNKVRYGLGWHR